MWRGHCYGVDLIPGPGISAGHEYSRKKKKKLGSLANSPGKLSAGSKHGKKYNFKKK